MKILLILTATIEPGGMIYTQRTDPTVRMEDYRKALNLWLGHCRKGWVNNIIFCENSGSNLAPLKNLVRQQGVEDRVHFVQWNNNNQWCNLGKGFGEARMLEDLLKVKQTLLEEHDYIVKVTGRLFVPNIRKCLKYLGYGLDIISAPFDKDGNRVDSRMFVLNFRSYSEFFKSFSAEVNDEVHKHFENVLAEKITENRLLMRWDPFWVLPFYVGVSGTSDQSLNSFRRMIRFGLMSLMYRVVARRKLWKRNAPYNSLSSKGGA